MQNHFVKYNALASRLLLAPTRLRRNIELSDGNEEAGEICKTPCMALGACSTDIMEKYIKLFMSNGRESPMKVVYADSMDGEKMRKQLRSRKQSSSSNHQVAGRDHLFGNDVSHSSVSVSITFRIHCSL